MILITTSILVYQFMSMTALERKVKMPSYVYPYTLEQGKKALYYKPHNCSHTKTFKTSGSQHGVHNPLSQFWLGHSHCGWDIHPKCCPDDCHQSGPQQGRCATASDVPGGRRHLQLHAEGPPEHTGDCTLLLGPAYCGWPEVPRVCSGLWWRLDLGSHRLLCGIHCWGSQVEGSWTSHHHVWRNAAIAWCGCGFWRILPQVVGPARTIKVKIRYQKGYSSLNGHESKKRRL